MSRELKLDAEDYKQMLKVQREMADLLRKINDRGAPPQAFLVAVALMRLAANLLNFYPPDKQQALRLIAEKLMEHGMVNDAKELHRLVTLH
jgi:hypothetical protein